MRILENLCFKPVSGLTQTWTALGLYFHDGLSKAGEARLVQWSPARPVRPASATVGNLFKSKTERSERTELMVLITPRLVRPLDPDEVPALPTQPGRFLPPSDSIGTELDGGGGPVDAPPVKTQENVKKPPVSRP